MVEIPLLLVIIALVVFVIRSGASRVNDEPLIVQRAGQFHITLDPRLVHARNFLESIAECFESELRVAGDIAGQFFEVHDGAHAEGDGCYLLAVAMRAGVLYIQAIAPRPLLRDGDSHLDAIRQFADEVLSLKPMSKDEGRGTAQQLRAAVMEAASRTHMDCRVLQD